MSLSADIAVNDFVDREPKSVLESSKSQAKDGQRHFQRKEGRIFKINLFKRRVTFINTCSRLK